MITLTKQTSFLSDLISAEKGKKLQVSAIICNEGHPGDIY